MTSFSANISQKTQDNTTSDTSFNTTLGDASENAREDTPETTFLSLWSDCDSGTSDGEFDGEFDESDNGEYYEGEYDEGEYDEDEDGDNSDEDKSDDDKSDKGEGDYLMASGCLENEIKVGEDQEDSGDAKGEAQGTAPKEDGAYATPSTTHDSLFSGSVPEMSSPASPSALGREIQENKRDQAEAHFQPVQSTGLQSPVSSEFNASREAESAEVTTKRDVKIVEETFFEPGGDLSVSPKTLSSQPHLPQP